MRKSKCLFPLALGTFGLGMTEFVMMGILPDTARTLGVSIPTAGHFISCYALGVVTGSILLVIFGRSKPLKNVLVTLIGIYTIANFLTAFAPNYYIMCLLRFIAGFPHGAFFGVGSIVADKLADNDKKNQAIAIMVSGMTIANLAGIPLGTFVSHNFSWRYLFLAIGLLGLAVLYSIIKLIPNIKPLPDTGFRGQFKIFKSLAPWLLILAVITGNGGIFCWYSYINPLLVNFSHIPSKFVSPLMVFAGAGMCAGNLIGGKLSDKYAPSLVAGITQLTAFIALVLIFFFASNPVISIILMCICTGCLFGVSAPQQLLLIKNAKGGEILGASCSQISFNLGNAIGAYIGGLPIAAGMGYEYTALTGCWFTLLGFGILLYFYFRYRARNCA